MSEDAGCADRFLCVPLATVTKPISDLRLLISGLFPLPFALGLVNALLFALSVPAQAQQQAKVAKIGWLGSRPAIRENVAARGSEIIRRELHALGYVEGKNIAFEYRSAEGEPDRLTFLADELVRLKVDVLVMSTPDAVLAAKKATTTIPIVFLLAGDPVAAGFVDSLARPGGNITGFTTISTVLAGKRLELLKETVPKLSRVAVLWDPRAPGSVRQWKENQLQAKDLGLQLHSMEVSSVAKFEGAFKDAIQARSTALAVLQSPFTSTYQKQITELAARHRLPAIYPREDFVGSGGLMSYGADRIEPYRRVASLIDKILKGAKPANLPVEQPTKFELIINLKTAKALGLTIPPVVLMRAEKVIK
jgi:putative tryptophan/tyrosine transport system substrate-binding protein